MTRALLIILALVALAFAAWNYGGVHTVGTPAGAGMQAHDGNASDGRAIGQRDEDKATNRDEEGGKRENKNSERPQRHVLLCLQILLGCLFFIGGGYGFASAEYRIKRTGDFSAGFEAILYAPVCVGGYIIAIIGILLIQLPS